MCGACGVCGACGAYGACAACDARVLACGARGACSSWRVVGVLFTLYVYHEGRERGKQKRVIFKPLSSFEFKTARPCALVRD